MADLRMLKFPLRDMWNCPDEGPIEIMGPHPSLPQSLGVQDGVITLWAMSDGVHRRRVFHVRATGQVIGLPHGNLIGTVVDREYVWHVFETFEVPHG